MGYRLLADVVMVAHFSYLAYVAVGGFAAWRWPRAFWPHLAAVGWGLATVTVGLACPLTHAEDWAREGAGQAGLPPGGFIDHYIEGVVYPQQHAAGIRWLLAIVIGVSWLGLLLRRRRDTARRTASRLSAPRQLGHRLRWTSSPTVDDQRRDWRSVRVSHFIKRLLLSLFASRLQRMAYRRGGRNPIVNGLLREVDRRLGRRGRYGHRGPYRYHGHYRRKRW